MHTVKKRGRAMADCEMGTSSWQRYTHAPLRASRRMDGSSYASERMEKTDEQAAVRQAEQAIPQRWNDANFMSRVLLLWMWPTLWAGKDSRKPLKSEQIPGSTVPPQYRPARLTAILKYMWTQSKCRGRVLDPSTTEREAHGSDKKTGEWSEDGKVWLLNDLAHEDGEQLLDAANGGDGTESYRSLSVHVILIRCFWRAIVRSNLLYITTVSLQVMLPLLMRELLRELSKEEEEYNPSRAYFISIVFTLLALLGAIAANHANLTTTLIGVNMRSALIPMILDKILKMRAAAFHPFQSGDLINLISNDVQRIMEFWIVAFNWMTPFLVMAILGFLFSILGIAAFAGFGVLIISFTLMGALASRVAALRRKQMEYVDQRLSQVNDVLVGMKAVKFHAWEKPFIEHISYLRSMELDCLLKTNFIQAIAGAIMTATPVAVSLVTFAVYTALGNEMVSDIVFPAIALFNYLQVPLSSLPIYIAALVQASIADKRISNFLNASSEGSNTTNEAPRGKSRERGSVIVKGEFSWQGDTVAYLRNIDIDCSRGSLVAVTGSTGSGKTSLLHAILGEMNHLSGVRNVAGATAYVAQQAYIFNGTIKNNILFGLPLEESRYQFVLDVCCLVDDLDQLPIGDATEIGERGVNLSGGQKQRVSLARALYSDADIYILDDPLSALDPQVADRIMDDVICGCLQDKLCILVSGSLRCIRKADGVIVMREGEMIRNVSLPKPRDPRTLRKGESSDDFREHIIQELLDDGAIANEVEFSDDEHASECASGYDSFRYSTDVDGSGRMKTFYDCESQSLSEENSEVNAPLNGPVVEIAIQGRHSVHSMGGTLRTMSRKRSSGKAAGCSNIRCSNSFERTVRLTSEESILSGRVKASTYLNYMREGAPIPVWMVILLAFAAVEAGNLIYSWQLANWTSAVEEEGEEVETEFYLHILGVIVGVTVLIGFVKTFGVALVTVNAAKNLHCSLITHVFKAPMTFFLSNPLGRILNRFSRDTDQIDVVLPTVGHGFLYALFACASVFIAISLFIPIFAGFAVPIMITYILVAIFYSRTFRELVRIEALRRTPIFSVVSQALAGPVTIRAYGQGKLYAKSLIRSLTAHAALELLKPVANTWLGISLEIISSFVLGFTAFGVILFRERMTDGDAGLVLTYALGLSTALGILMKTATSTEASMNAFERIQEYGQSLDTEEGESERDNDIDENEVSSEWPATGCVEFRKFSMQYRSDLPVVLNNITFSIQDGEKIGVCGRTGSGKSSLIASIFRLVPSECMYGSIMIDGKNILDLPLDVLRASIGIVPQDPVLFHSSIRKNLDPFNNFSDYEISDALQMVNLTLHVEQLGGLDALVPHGGATFSSGQAQLLCIARALLRRPKILLSDEATACVDTKNDAIIQDTIRECFRSSTIITIAHRLDTIIDADRLMVMEAGRIVEFDSPDVLKYSDGKFAAMCRNGVEGSPETNVSTANTNIEVDDDNETEQLSILGGSIKRRDTASQLRAQGREMASLANLASFGYGRMLSK